MIDVRLFEDIAGNETARENIFRDGKLSVSMLEGSICLPATPRSETLRSTSSNQCVCARGMCLHSGIEFGSSHTVLGKLVFDIVTCYLNVEFESDFAFYHTE